MYKILFISCFLLLAACVSWGQSESIDSLRNEFDKLYGSDVILSNGRKYFPESISAKGNPFWREQNAFRANVTVLGVKFPNQQLKYDIHKQKFILLHQGMSGQQSQILLNTSFIDSVRTEDILFVRNPYQEINQPFIQVIYQGSVSCVVSLKKDLDFTNIGVNTGYGYSKEIRTYFLIINNSVYEFDSKSGFVKAFPPANRAVIRNQISLLQLKFKKLNEIKLRQLVEFCNRTIR
jgi:hypothetical protein